LQSVGPDSGSWASTSTRRADTIAHCMPRRVRLHRPTDALRPVRAPRWLPTPARRSAARAGTVAGAMAPKVTDDDGAGLPRRIRPAMPTAVAQALIDATDPETGQPISDDDIVEPNPVIFMLCPATTPPQRHSPTRCGCWDTTPRYRTASQQRPPISADRQLTPDDVPRLAYTGSGAERGLAAVSARRGGRPTGDARHRQ